jgi:hypothetical protein
MVYKQKVQAYVNGESDSLDEDAGIENDESPRETVHDVERTGESSFFSPSRRFSSLDQDVVGTLAKHFHDGEQNTFDDSMKRPYSMPHNMFGTNDKPTPFSYESNFRLKREIEETIPSPKRAPLHRSSSATIILTTPQFSPPLNSQFESINPERPPLHRSYSAQIQPPRSPSSTSVATPIIKPVVRPALIRAHSSPSGCVQQPQHRPNLQQFATMNVHNNSLVIGHESVSTGGSTPMSLCSLSPRDASPATPQGMSNPIMLTRPSFKRSVSHSNVYIEERPISKQMDCEEEQTTNNLAMRELRQVSPLASPLLTVSPKSSGPTIQYEQHTSSIISTRNGRFTPPPMRKAFSTNTVFHDKGFNSSPLDSNRSPTNMGPNDHNRDYAHHNEGFYPIRNLQVPPPTDGSNNMLPSLSQLFGNNFVQQTRPIHHEALHHRMT